MQHILLFAFWVLYCVLHSLLAGKQLKEKLKRQMGEKFQYYRIFYTIFAFVTLVLLLFFQLSIESPKLFDAAIFFTAAGMIITLCGVAIMFVCIKKYFFSLSGLQSLFKDNKSHELIVTGIHKHVRHPLYSGTFLFIWGLLLLFPYLSFFIADLVITLYTIIAIKFEEEKLVDEFGEAYEAYQKEVPKLIPAFRISR